MVTEIAAFLAVLSATTRGRQHLAELIYLRLGESHQLHVYRTLSVALQTRTYLSAVFLPI